MASERRACHARTRVMNRGHEDVPGRDGNAPAGNRDIGSRGDAARAAEATASALAAPARRQTRPDHSPLERLVEPADAPACQPRPQPSQPLGSRRHRRRRRPRPRAPGPNAHALAGVAVEPGGKRARRSLPCALVTRPARLPISPPPRGADRRAGRRYLGLRRGRGVRNLPQGPRSLADRRVHRHRRGGNAGGRLGVPPSGNAAAARQQRDRFPRGRRVRASEAQQGRQNRRNPAVRSHSSSTRRIVLSRFGSGDDDWSLRVVLGFIASFSVAHCRDHGTAASRRANSRRL